MKSGFGFTKRRFVFGFIQKQTFIGLRAADNLSLFKNVPYLCNSNQTENFTL